MQGNTDTMSSSKKSFLLLSGLMREQRHWGEFPEILQARFPGSEIFIPDIPGNGRNFRTCSPDSIEKITDFVRQQQAPKSDRLFLIGQSMGGMSAIDWMQRYPEEISCAVLINTSARPYSPFFHRLRWTCYPSILKLAFQKPAQQEKTLLNLLSNLKNQDGTLLQDWRTWRRQYPVSQKSVFNQLLACTVFKSTEKPQHPVMIAASKTDRLVDFRCSVSLHQAWQTAYQEHPYAGHILPLDDPDWLAEKIENWYMEIQPHEFNQN